MEENVRLDHLCYQCGLSIKQMDLSGLTEAHAQKVRDYVKNSRGVRVLLLVGRGRMICQLCGAKVTKYLTAQVYEREAS